MIAGVELTTAPSGSARTPSITAVAESGIRTLQDIERLSAAGYHAFLVGERLIAQPNPGAALRTLRGGQA